MSTTTFDQAITTHYTGKLSRPFIFKKLINWCDSQQQNRLLWLGIGLAAHGCLITPLAFFVVLLTGVNMALLASAMFAMAMVLIVNLAALPTKITIPVFFLSIVIDLIIMISAYTIF